ncbi:gliding motility lipoprotein GldH, partial [Phocaeicola dorei]
MPIMHIAACQKQYKSITLYTPVPLDGWKQSDTLV